MESDPICSSIVASDAVIREEGTGKLTLVGCFQNFAAQKFPFKGPPFFITPFITNLEGRFAELHIACRIEDPESAHVIASTGGKLTLRDEAPPLVRAVELEIPLPFQGVVFPTAGQYKVVVLLNKDEIGHRFLIVQALTLPSA